MQPESSEEPVQANPIDNKRDYEKWCCVQHTSTKCGYTYNSNKQRSLQERSPALERAVMLQWLWSGQPGSSSSSACASVADWASLRPGAPAECMLCVQPIHGFGVKCVITRVRHMCRVHGVPSVGNGSAYKSWFATYNYAENIDFTEAAKYALHREATEAWPGCICQVQTTLTLCFWNRTPCPPAVWPSTRQLH